MIFNIENTGVGVGKMSEGTTANPILEVNYPSYFYAGANLPATSFVAEAYTTPKYFNGCTGITTDANYCAPRFRKLGDHVFLDGWISFSPVASDTALFFVPGPCRPMNDKSWTVTCYNYPGYIGEFEIKDGRVVCRCVCKLDSDTDVTTGGPYQFELTYDYWVNHANSNLNKDTADAEETYVIYNAGPIGGVSWKANAASFSSTYYTANYSSANVDNNGTMLWTIGGNGSSSYAFGKNIVSAGAVDIPSDAKYLKFTIPSCTVYNSKTIQVRAGLSNTNNPVNPITTILGTAASGSYSASSSSAVTIQTDVSAYRGQSKCIIINVYSQCPTANEDINMLRISKIEFTKS